MQRFGNLQKWNTLGHGQEIEFPAGQPVRLEVVSPGIVDWHYMTDYSDFEGIFLTRTDGLEVIEFTPDTDIRLCTSAESAVVRYSTSSGIAIHREDDGEPSFTGIPNRKVQNTEYEKVAQIAALNTARRMEAFYGEQLALRDQQIAELGERVDRTTGEIIDPPATGDTVSETLEDQGEADTGSSPATSGEGSSGASSDSEGGEGDQSSDS